MSIAVATAELTAMKAVQEELMTETCTRKRVTSGHNDLGEAIASTASVSLSCRAASPQRLPMEITVGGEETYQVDIIISVPVGSDVLVNDLMTYGGGNYRVVSVSNGTMETALRILGQRL